MNQGHSFAKLLEDYQEIFFIAPTGAGKTSLMLEFFTSNDFHLFYLSPLRALADELEERLINDVSKSMTKRASKAIDFSDFIQRIEQGKKTFFVATVEMIPDGFFEELQQQREKVVVVVDEIHLFFHWGEEFRPILLERLYEIKNYQFKQISLTATFSKEHYERLVLDHHFSNEAILILDVGNYGLKKDPNAVHFYSPTQKQMLEKKFWNILKNKKATDTILVFLQFRREVDFLVERLQRHGFEAIGCVSGEVSNFRQNLREIMSNGQNPDVIVATTCLSHGVNLPKLSHIFLFYPIAHRDFWVQMVGRGGRRGEDFKVFEMNGFDQKGKLKKKWMKNIECLKNIAEKPFVDLWG